jgi:hypothetical protein
MLNINALKKYLFANCCSDKIETGIFLDNCCMHRLSGVRKLLGAVRAFPRKGINDVMDA